MYYSTCGNMYCNRVVLNKGPLNGYVCEDWMQTNLVVWWENKLEDNDKPDECRLRVVKPKCTVQFSSLHQHGKHHEAQKCIHLEHCTTTQTFFENLLLYPVFLSTLFLLLLVCMSLTVKCPWSNFFKFIYDTSILTCLLYTSPSPRD